jgi:hypothetical protein
VLHDAHIILSSSQQAQERTQLFAAGAGKKDTRNRIRFWVSSRCYHLFALAAGINAENCPTSAAVTGTVHCDYIHGDHDIVYPSEHHGYHSRDVHIGGLGGDRLKCPCSMTVTTRQNAQIKVH